ncbi:hypothetical protein [Streptacidiphilus neutrinimicus]|uniref:hypothetical protein n=1 Tax=Streptacidiphilus neutrinimicus TaxID=105420 RepID=UPI0009FDAAE0|nr:hypothetical protein [Streptacidiphilus neutrinimicus]
MHVLKRDAFRCVICGRKASDHTEIELHVHHPAAGLDRGNAEFDEEITRCRELVAHHLTCVPDSGIRRQ